LSRNVVINVKQINKIATIKQGETIPIKDTGFFITSMNKEDYEYYKEAIVVGGGNPDDYFLYDNRLSNYGLAIVQGELEPQPSNSETK